MMTQPSLQVQELSKLSDLTHSHSDIMDFQIQQTPRFGLITPSKQHHTESLSSHIEYAGPEKKSRVNSERESHESNAVPGHDKHHHFRLPFSHTHYHDEKRLHSLSSRKLPFISADAVAKANGENGSLLWLVIDDIVYDVTDFSTEHPGGAMPLKHFAGKSCSWQFHKIHSKKTLDLYGEKFIVGITIGVPNPYEEKPGIFRQLWKSHHF